MRIREIHHTFFLFFVTFFITLLGEFILPKSVPGALDFNVYYYAGKYILAGKGIYDGVETGFDTGTPPFTYTPFAAIIFSILSLMPIQIAFSLFTSLQIIGFFFLIKSVTGGLSYPKVPLILMLVFVPTAPVSTNFLFGQINFVLAALCLADLLNPSNKRRWGTWIPSGLLVGIATGIKLTPGLFIIYMLLNRQWHMAVTSTATIIAMFGIGYLVLPEATRKFIEATGNYGQLVARSSQTIPFNNSLHGAILFLGGSDLMYYVLAAIAGTCSLWAARVLCTRGETLMAICVVGIGTTIVSPISWLHHWVWLAPAMIYCSAYLTRAALYLLFPLYLGSISFYIPFNFDVTAGDLLAASGQPAVMVLGFFMRYTVLLSGIVVTALLVWGKRRSLEQQSFLPPPMHHACTSPEYK